MSMISKCQCKECLSEGNIKVDLYKRGGRPAYLCSFHAQHLEAYAMENSFHYGKIKQNCFTFGMELETSFSDLKGRVELASAGFLPTSDCTVDVEFKSPVFEGLNAVSKQLITIERLINENHLSVSDNSSYKVGTHFHVGNHDYINQQTIGYIARFYHSLFMALSCEIQNNQEKAKRIFGRNFQETEWALPIDFHSNPNTHQNFINLQHSYSLEFRLCKFINAEQYTKLMHFCKEIVSAVINNFIVHFNDDDFDRSRYADITAYRKHKASVTSLKIVKLWEKL